MFTKVERLISSRNLRPKKKEGFLKAKAVITTSKVLDSVKKSRVNMIINIDRGDKIKVNKIKFSGNDKISNRKLLKAMK